MKKTIGLIFVSLLLLSSCSSSDENNSSSTSSSINPPSWILGTWLEENSLSSGFRFSDDDFCLLPSPNLQSCFKESIIQTNSSGATTNVNEEISNNNYSIEITLGSSIVSYEFEKISETQIRWTNSSIGSSEGPIYLKQ